MRYAAQAVRPLLLFAILLTGWEVYVRVSGISPALLPSPSEIARATVRDRSNMWRHTWVTIQTVALGVTGSLVLAVVIAILLDSWDWVRRTIYPALVVSQTLPIVAIAPLVVIWFGFGITSHARVVAMYTFFPMAIGLSQGLASTDTDAMRLLRTMGAGPGASFAQGAVSRVRCRSSSPASGWRCLSRLRPPSSPSSWVPYTASAYIC